MNSFIILGGDLNHTDINYSYWQVTERSYPQKVIEEYSKMQDDFALHQIVDSPHTREQFA